MTIILIALLLSLIDIAFVFYLISQIKKADSGSEKVREIAQAIREGAKAFLRREIRSMIIIFLLGALVLGLIQKTFFSPILFLLGGITSMIAGYTGMMISTIANSRTAYKAQSSFVGSFKIAIKGGEVMGFLVVGLGLLGVTIIWSIFQNPDLMINYALGASLVALFMRVGGGIFTKSADVGADLVGKTELNIPEDDHRNPAVIADNVGDNVGDIAGMGADLFESYIASIISAMVIGLSRFGTRGALLPILIASTGIISSLMGRFLIKLPKKLNDGQFIEQTAGIRKAMERGIMAANLFMLVFVFLITFFYFKNIGLFIAVISGLAAGLLIGKVTDYYTSEKKKPTFEVAKASQTGPSSVIMEGLVVGMKSTVLPVLSIALAVILAYHFGGLYGIALASLGVLGVLGLNLSTDCYGPIADNAAGIAEMSKLAPEARQRTEALDAVGNSTAAIGKGFAIASAALAGLAWLAAYSQQSGIREFNLLDSKILAGIFIGAMLPFFFSALAIKGVNQGALEIVNEVRRQFKEKKLLEGEEKPDYKRCVDLATKRAIHEMSYPALIVLFFPIIIGLFLGKEALAGMLIGSLSSGFLLALLMANSGASWDNAKKFIEAGNFGGKGSDGHKAAVVGDTLGDPFKDTAGPSLNILIKLLSVIALIILPFI